MTLCGSPALKLLLLLFSLGLAINPTFAQEQMSQAQDPDQHSQFGLWRTMNSQFPRIQTRAKCSYDVKVDGRWTSWWDFQIRSTYQATTDYIFLVEYGNSATNRNEFSAPGLVTAKYEDVYTNGTELLGTCSQNTTAAKGLRIRIKCAVPTGQTAPCYTDTNGNPIAAAAASGSVTGPRDASAASTQSGGNSGGNKQKQKPSPKADQEYCFCSGGGNGLNPVVSKVFSRDSAGNDVSVLQEEFKDWLKANNPGVQNIYADCRRGFATIEDAESLQKNPYVVSPNAKPVDWPPGKP